MQNTTSSRTVRQSHLPPTPARLREPGRPQHNLSKPQAKTLSQYYPSKTSNHSKSQAKTLPQHYHSNQSEQELVRPRRYSAQDGTYFDVVPLKARARKLSEDRIPCVIDRITPGGHVVVNPGKKYMGIETANQAARKLRDEYNSMFPYPSQVTSAASVGDEQSPPGKTS